MSGVERIRDFGRWLREVESNLSAPKAPRQALGLQDGAPVMLQRSGGSFEVTRAAKTGDRAPVYLNDDNALIANIQASPESAIYGPYAAKIEAARASPFPLGDGAYALTPKAASWDEQGAHWTLVAAPKQRIDEIRATLSSAGARPGAAFAMVDGRAIRFGASRSSHMALIAALIAIIAAIGAAISVSYGAAAIESQAQSRLTDARQALGEAESKAAAAQAQREAAAGPLRQAQIVGAALARAPSVVGRLAALSSATPDDAYLKRLSIRPEIISGEFIAPDAAALAVKIGVDPLFSSARLKGSARAEAETQQRATLDILPRSGE